MPHAEAMSASASPRAVQPGLLIEQTASTLFAAVVRVFRQHFRVIALCGLLPMVPFVLLDAVVKATAPKWALLAVLPVLVAGFIVAGVLTITVSDICLGNQPTVRRSYARVLAGKRWWHLISTALLYFLAVEVGVLLLVIPGLWLVMRGLFSSVVVALEGRRNRDAIRRSIALTKGQVWRLVGFLLPTYVALLALSMVVAVLASKAEGATAFLIHFIGNLVVLAIFSPAFSITMVLLYYDQRVRRESYDAQALHEDLMR